MTKYEGVEFADQQVRLNGHEFVGCVFTRCRLVFDATKPCKVQGCAFEDVVFVLEGAASDTAAFLSRINNIKGTGDVYVRNLFREITSDR